MAQTTKKERAYIRGLVVGSVGTEFPDPNEQWNAEFLLRLLGDAEMTARMEQSYLGLQEELETAKSELTMARIALRNKASDFDQAIKQATYDVVTLRGVNDAQAEKLARCRAAAQEILAGRLTGKDLNLALEGIANMEVNDGQRD